MGTAAMGTILLFLLIQFGALLLVGPFDTANMQAFEDPADPTNSIFYIGLVLLATAGMLVALRYGGDRILRLIIVVVSGMLSWYVFLVIVPTEPTIGGVPVIASIIAGIVTVALWVHPEWYVIDGVGVIMGAGAGGLFGISLSPLPAIVLLVVLAVYDALSVYGTEHMIDLAEGVMELKVPVILIVPTTWSYSFQSAVATDCDEDGNTEPGPSSDSIANDGSSGPVREIDDGMADDEESGLSGTSPLERDALFVGLGDAVIPTVLVASAAVFVDATPLIRGFALNAPAGGAVVGTMIGLVVLLKLVFSGRAHAGLPLLNGGAILGYLVGSLMMGIPVARALGL